MFEASKPLEALPHEVVAALSNSFIELVEHSDGRLPVNASVCDTDTMLETTRALGGHILTTSVDI